MKREAKLLRMEMREMEAKIRKELRG